MDIFNSANTETVPEHNGTARVWWLIRPDDMPALEGGAYLDLAAVFEVEPGQRLDRHSHPIQEFYYVLAGSGWMEIGQEEQPVGIGDLIHIPTNEIHSLKADMGGPIRCLGFAVGIKGAPRLTDTNLQSVSGTTSGDEPNQS